ncbi:hypothetical protein [Methylocella tundrae]|uniref:Uncharacterized protein n=1 Tax=Methylocella tundrae TaxID=227605 RepID=A0A4V6IMC1_METTU|nr:hypothetical protein [Methylocella tundrae]WPP05481.1 hypothetical protein SIN04_06565 [Methylocella tundrae]VFU07903.1 protein of unknown function [Methylocella tundrae]
MNAEITRSEAEEIELLKGRILVLETALGKLVWRCARLAPKPAGWLARLRLALGGAQQNWTIAPPLGKAAMREAEDRLGEILHALHEGELAFSPQNAVPREQPRLDLSSWL